MVNCDSGAVNYRNEVSALQGALTTETTIVRTSGQSDGTTAVSRKIVTNTNPAWGMPFEAPPIAIWNETTGSAITVTLYGIWGGGAVPNNDDFWIDVEYLGSSGSPVLSRATALQRQRRYAAHLIAVRSFVPLQLPLSPVRISSTC
jgi:hypothetical protein